jgi:hypothetical protein
MNTKKIQGNEVDLNQSLLKGDNESDTKFNKFVLEGRLS